MRPLKLSENQRKCSIELVAIYLALLEFKPQIEDRHITVFTDHKLRVTAFQKTTPMKSNKQQRHLSLKSEYLADILYFRREENLVADCLSKTEN